MFTFFVKTYPRTRRQRQRRLRQQYHTPLAVGTLLGMTTMMSQFMFVLFAVFLALAKYAETGSLARNDLAMAVFAFFLFILYVSALLVVMYTLLTVKCQENMAYFRASVVRFFFSSMLFYLFFCSFCLCLALSRFVWVFTQDVLFFR